MSIGLLLPWLLWLLPAAVLPLIVGRGSRLDYPTFALLPSDPLSKVVDAALRVAAALAVALLILGAGGLHRKAVQVERIGTGAEIVLLLDRSRSMDEPFADDRARSPLSMVGHDSKGTIARGLLDEFVTSRRNDRYGMLIFSTKPIPILPLTDQADLVRATIAAGDVGRGLAETNVGAGLLEAVEYFADQPYRGSRLVVLISDGGARLDVATRYRIANSLKRHRVGLYWIYLRSPRSPGISDDAPSSERIAPARVLHQFFASLETPYRAYDAEDPEALRRAIADVNRLQTLPIHYLDTVPRRDLAVPCYRAALALLLLLVAAHLMERRAWTSD